MLRKHGAKIIAFIPGERHLRLPLRLGLPTLEVHRDQNPYVSYLDLKRIYGIDEVGVAEGILLKDTIDKIVRYETKNRITLPIECSKDVKQCLTSQPFQVRIEETDYSYRLNETRGIFPKESRFYKEAPDGLTEYGGVYVDGSHYGRYQGEIHICTTAKGVPMKLHQIGRVKKEFQGILPMLSGAPMIQFE